MFGFKKKPQNSPFYDWLLSTGDKWAWVARYITPEGNVNWELAEEDMQWVPNRIYVYDSRDKFSALLRELEESFFDAHRTPEQRALTQKQREINKLHMKMYGLDIIDRLQGLTVRRIQPRDAGNRYAVKYLGSREFYGKTLIEALTALLENVPAAARRAQSKEVKGE